MKIVPARISEARLRANMSRADLAHAIRQHTGNDLRASERGVRGWEKGEHAPSASAIAAIAQAVGYDIEFFYTEADPDDEETVAALPPDLAEALQTLARYTGIGKERVQ